MKKWLGLFIVVAIASFGITYGFDDSSAYEEDDPICCSIKEGNYYGSACTLTDKVTYQMECEEHYCEVVGGTYYDRAGNIVNKDTFAKECPNEVITEEEITAILEKYLDGEITLEERLVVTGGYLILGMLSS